MRHESWSKLLGMGIVCAVAASAGCADPNSTYVGDYSGLTTEQTTVTATSGTSSSTSSDNASTSNWLLHVEPARTTGADLVAWFEGSSAPGCLFNFTRGSDGMSGTIVAGQSCSLSGMDTAMSGGMINSMTTNTGMLTVMSGSFTITPSSSMISLTLSGSITLMQTQGAGCTVDCTSTSTGTYMLTFSGARH